MDRNNFILELRKHLRSMEKSEMEDAISYYEEYFAEAGVDSEENVIADLGSPEEVAMKVLSEYTMKNTESDESSAKKWSKMIWVVILGIFASPVALPVAIAVIISILAVIIACIAVILSVFAASLAIFVSGIATLIMGASLFMSDFATSIFFIGSGIIMAGIGILLFLGTFILSKFSLKGISVLIAKYFIRRSGK